ncbi:hypothetical protein ACWDWO_08620 [Actinopolymorpha singaporensis]|uniref:Uncharacterized protein n=1 Tax=Actinopolymorpha singaporensis TaxID=117157 RepID=A0A1H1M007_9ACTN|nr:hypothetical protein [Actinopolymorpha singaporensis]SDR80081.1 hypothetical protein SAMN04489717_0616 [Actinopolymorpha singaporensis]
MSRDNARGERGGFTWSDPRAFFGLLVIIGFGGFVAYLSEQARSWDHYVSLYAGVAAVVAATLGAVLGFSLNQGRISDAKTEMNHAVLERQEMQARIEGAYAVLADARETLAKVEVVLRETSALRAARKNDPSKHVESLGLESSALAEAANSVREQLPPEAELVDATRVHEVDPRFDHLALSADELLDEVRARHRYLRRID